MDFKNEFRSQIAPYKEPAMEVLKFLIHFIRNPVETIKNVPPWPWPQLMILFVLTAAITGTVAGIISFKISKIFFGLIIFPISSLIGGLFLSGFFYYTSLLIYQKEIPFKTAFTIVTLSLIPFFALYTLSSFVPLLQLVGFALTGILLVVGFSENTKIDRKKVTQLVIGLYLAYLLLTIANMISWESKTESYKRLATPDSIEKLKKEFESND